MNIYEIIKQWLLFLLLYFLIFHISLHSKNIINIKAKCIKVIDGNTILFKYHEFPLVIKLKYADAYEIRKTKHLEKQKEITKLSEKQIFLLGELATRLTKSLIKKNHIYCIQIDKDEDKSIIFSNGYPGIIYITDECEGITLSDILLEAKLAIPTNLYSKSNKNKQK